MRKMLEEKLRKAVAESISIAEALKFMGMSISTGNYRGFHNSIKKYNIDTSHFLGQSHLQNKSHKTTATYPINEILVENSTYVSISILKKRLVREKLLPYKCGNEKCNIVMWHDKPLSLQLDHINGIHNDHRLENLRFLCPNCHSQTDTFAGKNKISASGES